MSLSPLPVNALTTENLRQFPVWRYLHDDEGGEGTDESFVTPADEMPPARGYGSFVVAACYRLHGGAELPGAVQLDLLGSKRQFTPLLIHAAGSCLDPLAADIAARLARLRKAPDGPPVGWRLDITLPGDRVPATGRIHRSLVLKAFTLFVQLAALFLAPRGR